jgi:hypothetical protein
VGKAAERWPQTELVSADRPGRALRWLQLSPFITWTLYQDASLVVDSERRKLTDAEVKQVGDLLAQFHCLDPTGQGARYDTDNHDGVILRGVREVAIEHTMRTCGAYPTCCTT